MTPASAELFQSLPHQLLFRLLSIPRGGPEISDRIVAFDGHSGTRVPVSKEDLIRQFESLDSPRAARIVAGMAANHDGTLKESAVDELLVTVHCEMQRLSEEFQHGRRMAELLNPLLDTLRKQSSNTRLRVVDIGCGTGYVLRWLAAHRALPAGVELVGADYNPAL